MGYTLVNRDDLPHDGDTYDFEGTKYPNTNVSFIWVNMKPGGVVRLHQHPYEEIFLLFKKAAVRLPLVMRRWKHTRVKS